MKERAPCLQKFFSLQVTGETQDLYMEMELSFFLNYLLINIGHGEEKKKSRKLDQQVSGNGGLMTLSASLLQLGNRGGRNRVGRCSLLNLVYFVL
jgi:hypothetical protein